MKLTKIVTAGLAGLLVATLSACTNSSLDESSTAQPASAGFPVSVQGKLGTATIPAEPKRVVAMDWTSADIALSLGVTPVGMAKVATADGGIEPWTKPALGSNTPTLFDTSSSDPIDQVAALKPDLIVATKDYNLGESYQQLSQIAPVVTYTDAPNSDSWETSTRNIAKALGKSDQAEQIITKTNADIAAAKTAHPELAGKTYNFLVTPQASGVYAVNSTQDVSARFLDQLGMTLSSQVQSMPTSSIPGRTLVSWENVAQLDANVLFATGSPSSLKVATSNTGFNNLPVVERGAYLPLEPALAQAIAFPSSVSLEWALGQLVPKISEASGK
ncbi:iron-siderophore ABC transporter substrate-binding protein [Amycolatopsis acidicola]|uniref:Iron-siderophore ABC transporter substrate-binding protein n=1 Tax=Amycolatopsis acidicola TaxID=2596893 RepID=A0A5N0UZS3_9PSEU|nr:iron-siderophore ABC transporter substrate-binding protein [Amycolatopsis acidicola]KAA9158720.1 iron-siderophore ABC transporter substrate-binding protein [Amycolatopsis acidicola]